MVCMVESENRGGLRWHHVIISLELCGSEKNLWVTRRFGQCALTVFRKPSFYNDIVVVILPACQVSLHEALIMNFSYWNSNLRNVDSNTGLFPMSVDWSVELGKRCFNTLIILHGTRYIKDTYNCLRNMEQTTSSHPNKMSLALRSPVLIQFSLFVNYGNTCILAGKQLGCTTSI